MKIAMPIPPWEIEAAAIEHAHDLGDGPYLEKGLKQQLKSFLDLDIGIFHDNAGGITDQTYRQGERKLPALSLCEQPRCQPGTDGMELQLRYRPLQAQQQSTIWTAWIVHAVPVGDQTAPQPTDIEQGIPIRTVPREPCHVDRQDQTDLAQADPAYHFLEAARAARQMRR